jgi:hypothetical protein
MFVDYTKLVLRSYEEKKARGTLSPRLIHPTPAKLKEECEAVFSARYERKDQRTLNVFFGQTSEGEAGLKAIKRCETDKFKPLANFLIKKTQTTEDKNIELLAWLIDFDQRPYEYGKRYDAENVARGNNADKKTETAFDKGEAIVKPDFLRQSEQSPQLIVSPQILNKNRFKPNITIIASVILIVVVGVIYWMQSDKSQTGSSLGFIAGQECMCWMGDHYEQVSCSKHGDTLVVALDTFKLKHFKKINLPDTITQNAVGAVWYIKANGDIEFFTSGGYYPLDPKRKLKPITDYIIKKYIHPDR